MPGPWPIDRNHPSVVVWSIENEVFSSTNISNPDPDLHGHGPCAECFPEHSVSDSTLRSIGAALRTVDGYSRPVEYDGDFAMGIFSGDVIFNVHYPHKRVLFEEPLPTADYKDSNRPYFFPEDGYIYWASGVENSPPPAWVNSSGMPAPMKKTTPNPTSSGR